MPTTRPRHIITETDEVRAALDLGQERWPGLSRGRVAARLVEEAGRGLDQQRDERAARRRAALRNPPAEAARWHGENYLEQLREDWPE